MGKKKPWNKKRNLEQQPKPEVNVKGVRLNYEGIVKENANFEQYYKLQKICPDDEWSTMMNFLRESLPTAFRITGSRSQAKALLHIIENNLIRDVVGAVKTGEEIDIRPFPLPWYPENLALQLNLTRKDIRNNEALFRLHNFLVSETESGNISRQEAVSMIPPLALKVEPHHKVLDMCAAPGSKTAQIIEMLHSEEGKVPEGFVVANDVDNKRCYMLVHQGKRLQSPAFIVTNHEAGNYPDLYSTNSDGIKTQVKFDRVLCDVPCSGDGTIRKNIDVWKKWSPANGMFLHQTQYQILKRGLELLEIGGRLVYSTCSLNPIENEAVIHRILKEGEGSVELMSIELPHLKHIKGLSHWTPCSRDLAAYSKMEEVPKQWVSTIRPGMFPPSEEDAAKFHLDKCVRVLPHQQDTGGFFISLLTKTRHVPWKSSVKPEECRSSEPVDDKKIAPPPKKLRRTVGYKEDPFVFMTSEDPIWPHVREFYGLDPSLDSTHFLRRCHEGKIKNIYLTTGAVRDFVINNESSVKIINVGVKTLARVDKKWTPCDFRLSQEVNKWRTPCDFRLSQEGLPALLPFIKGRIVHVTRQDLEILLLNDDENRPPEMTLLSDQTRIELQPLERGSMVLIVDTEVKDGPKFRMVLVGWKGVTSLRAYVQKDERMHFLRLLGADVSKWEKNKFKDIEVKPAADVSKEEVTEANGSKPDSTTEEVSSSCVEVVTTQNNSPSSSSA